MITLLIQPINYLLSKPITYVKIYFYSYYRPLTKEGPRTTKPLIRTLQCPAVFFYLDHLVSQIEKCGTLILLQLAK
jgi:hypothetical protein